MYSKLQFTITQMAVSDVDGEFKDFSAVVTLEKSDFYDAQFKLTANSASVNTGIHARDNHLKSAEFFDIANFTTLAFTSSSITKTTNNHYKLAGNLTLHGVTKAVVMDLRYRGTITNPMSKADDAGFQLSGTIKRSDFGFVSKYGSPMLSDEKAIRANCEFAKAKLLLHG